MGIRAGTLLFWLRSLWFDISIQGTVMTLWDWLFIPEILEFVKVFLLDTVLIFLYKSCTFFTKRIWDMLHSYYVYKLYAPDLEDYFINKPIGQ